MPPTDDVPAGALGDDVRAHIDELGPEHRALFDRLHALILDELPEAHVVISYQIPRAVTP